MLTKSPNDFIYFANKVYYQGEWYFINNDLNEISKDITDNARFVHKLNPQYAELSELDIMEIRKHFYITDHKIVKIAYTEVE